MKILSMTATFGKLEHETLTLKPGLNIIEAPNEWGKSTWCAFLVSMLYGIDTRERSTGTALAAKERYAPWSGAPMSGRIDLNWNGRDITIERSTRGRLIFGDFRAYETATGIEIAELNSTNCGQMLLGVERSVFTRAGFLKLSDLPVTQDDALRRRLNSLVTTGDESGAGERLAKQLKELKNKCRYNRSGLLPQAEAQQEQLISQLGELQELAEQAEIIRQRQSDLEKSIALLENHKTALRYEASKADLQKVAAAEEALEQANHAVADKESVTQGLAEKDAILQDLHTARKLQDHLTEQPLQPSIAPPVKPDLPDSYEPLTADEILALASADHKENQRLENDRKQRSGLIAGICITLFAIVAALAVLTFMDTGIDKLWLILGDGAALIALLSIAIWGIVASRRFRKAQDVLFLRHPGISPDRWLSEAESYAAALRQYEAALSEYDANVSSLTQQRQDLEQQIHALTGGKGLSSFLDDCRQRISAWDALDEARRELRRAESYALDLRSMVKPAEKPTQPDMLTQTEEETDALLTSARFELKQLQLKLGQNQGRTASLGNEATLRNQLKAVNRRTQQLEDTYTALEYAQRALSAATTELQRRFAPRISKRAQELFAKLTGGRYQQITLGEDLSLNARTESEDTLRSSQWRSDGTIDQLYLALRLAVAEELTPEAPLILDDALVRFDDQRLAIALNILKEAAESKQVIVFTCQGRESAAQ